MGQKCSPEGIRRTLDKQWHSRWYVRPDLFGKFLYEDILIRKHIASQKHLGILSKVLIERKGGQINITISSIKPGLIIGKKGSGIEGLRKGLKKLINKEVFIDVVEVKRGAVDARTVAEVIAEQISNRASYKRVIRKAISSAMDSGAKGIKVIASGRLAGVEIARTEEFKEGSIPLSTLRADIDYSTSRAETTYGSIGIKVMIHKGSMPGFKE